jgi:hypothetical protein
MSLVNGKERVASRLPEAAIARRWKGYGGRRKPGASSLRPAAASQ